MSASESVPVTAPSLTEFLLARIAEDEEGARAIHAERCDTPASLTSVDTMGRPFETACGCDRHIGRALAECEAKRRIVKLHGGNYDGECLSPAHLDGPCRTLRALALPYADHPDCRQEWRA